jgi:hypothetical protein
VTATATWAEDQPSRATSSDEVAQLWADIEGHASQPTVLTINAAGATISAVIGDPTGTVLVYFPPGYDRTGTGSLHSVGDPIGAEREKWEPPFTAYYFGHHNEFPRWAVVPHEDGRRALAQFCERPDHPPQVITWEPD